MHAPSARLLDIAEEVRRRTIDRFLSVRATTERLAAPLSAEDQGLQSMPDASPTKWYRAHTTWFFETFVLEPHDPNYTPLHAGF